MTESIQDAEDILLLLLVILSLKWKRRMDLKFQFIFRYLSTFYYIGPYCKTGIGAGPSGYDWIFNRNLI